MYVHYGSIQALWEVTFSISQGEIVDLLGSNGAGKTTTLKALSGLLPVRRGEILFRGREIRFLPADERVGLGLLQVPEGRRIFSMMTVEENLLMGGFHPARRSGRRATIERVLEMFPILRERRQQLGGTLGGRSQCCGARCLSTTGLSQRLPTCLRPRLEYLQFCRAGGPSMALVARTFRVQLPRAERNGVEVVTRCDVQRIANKKVFARVSKKLEGNKGESSTWEAGDYQIDAKVVVVCAGAVNSPALLRSGFGRSLQRLGHGFTCHPAFIMVAEHSQPITNFVGQSKSFYLDQFAESDHFLLVTRRGADPDVLDRSTDTPFGYCTVK